MSLLVAQQHESHPTDVATLFRKRFAVAAETKERASLSEAKVKNLTGADRLTDRRMHEDFWEFDPTHTLLLHTNYKPRIEGTDEGIWRRVRLIPWTVVIPNEERDEGLTEKLELQAQGILCWIVKGAQKFLTEGWEVPRSILAASREYRLAEDVVGRCLHELVEKGGPDDYVAFSSLEGLAQRWCQEESVARFTPNELGEGLKRLGATKRRRQVGYQKLTEWGPLRLQEGVELTNVDDLLPSQDSTDKKPTEMFNRPLTRESLGLERTG